MNLQAINTRLILAALQTSNVRLIGNATKEVNYELIGSLARKMEENGNRGAAFRAVSRTAELTSVGNWIAKQLADKTQWLEDSLVAVLQASNPVQTTATLPKLFADADMAINRHFHNAKAETLNLLKRLAGVLAEKSSKSFALQFGIAPRTMPGDPNNLPVLGAPIDEHFDKIASNLSFKFRATIRAGLDNDETLEQLVKRVRGEAPVELANATLAEEATKRFLTQLKLIEGTDQSVSKIIQAAVEALGQSADSAAGEAGAQQTQRKVGWEWSSIADPKTCPQCQFYDGSRWTLDYKPIDDAPEFPGAPGLHFNCRCSVIPVDLEEAPAPEMDFDDYLRRFTRAEQERAFGSENVRAYRRGLMTAADLVGQQDNLLTLEEFAV